MANNGATGSGTTNQLNNDRPFINVKIGNLRCLAHVAVGSPQCIIGEHLFEQTGYSRNTVLQLQDMVRRDVFGNSYKLIGRTVFNVEWEDQVTQLPFIVVPKRIEDLVLGANFVRMLGMIFNYRARTMESTILGFELPFAFAEETDGVKLNHINILVKD